MGQISVTCRCTRRMTQEPGRRAGYLMCSCGTRVRVDDARTSTCVVPEPSGRYCERPILPDMPFPVCRPHHAELLRDVRFTGGTYTGADIADIRNETAKEVIEAKSERTRRRALEALEDDLRADAYREQSVVYYVRARDHIKIGVTTNMQARMAALQPDEILATEPGDRRLEKQRHRLFAHLLGDIGSEYFRRGPELDDHIRAVRERHGEPNMTTYPGQDMWKPGGRMMVPVATAAKLAGVSERTVYDWINHARMTSTRNPGRKRGTLVDAVEAQELAGLRHAGRLPRVDKAG